jgi:transposase
MNQEKYIGMDVHQATISVAVSDSSGKLIMECILETKAATILEFIAGLRGTLSATFEEGTSAAWLHDLLKPHVSHLVVCDPRRNALLRDGSERDRIDARKLAELLHGNKLHAVYHGEHGLRTLKELGRSYLTNHQRCHPLHHCRMAQVSDRGSLLKPKKKRYRVYYMSEWSKDHGETEEADIAGYTLSSVTTQQGGAVA